MQSSPNNPSRLARLRRPSLDILAPFILLLAAALFMSPGLPPFRVAAPMGQLLVYSPWDKYYPQLHTPLMGGDLLLQQLPWRHWEQNELAAGRVPLWASGPVGGEPLLGYSQAAVFHFLNLLWVLMPVGAGLGVIMTLKLALAGWGMWILLRSLRLHLFAVGITTLSFMFSAPIVNWLPSRDSASDRPFARPNIKFPLFGLLALAGTVLLVCHATSIVPRPSLQRSGGFYQIDANYQIYWALWAVGLGLLVAGLCGLWVTVPRTRILATSLLCVVALLDLWSVLLPVNGTAPADQYFPPTNFFSKVLEFVPSTERILVNNSSMPANSGLVYGIRDWRSSDPMISERAYQALTTLEPDITANIFDQYYMTMRRPRIEIAPLLGMRYYVGTGVNNPPEEGSPPFTRLAFKDGLGIWRAEGVPGFAYLSNNVTAVASGQEALSWLRKATWQTARGYMSVAEMDASTADKIRASANDPSSSVAVLEYTSGYIKLETTSSHPALLVVAESWYPGWKAGLDGVGTQIVRANYLSQGVVVPAGKHLVELRYEPASVTTGAMLSGAGVLGVIFMALYITKGPTAGT